MCTVWKSKHDTNQASSTCQLFRAKLRRASFQLLGDAGLDPWARLDEDPDLNTLRRSVSSVLTKTQLFLLGHLQFINGSAKLEGV
jgi:hypothetical protein